MPLRQRLETVPETVQEFDLAAREKYREGEVLLASGHRGAGVYLLGYSAEMLLKSAYFRFVKSQIGLRKVTSTITGPMLRNAAREGIRLHIRYDPESYHSLLFWGLLLSAIRKDQADPLPGEIERECFCV